MINKKVRDIILAVLTIGGIFYIIEKNIGLMIYLLKGYLSLWAIKIIIVLESVVFLIAGLVFWEKIYISSVYHKYFVYILVILLALDLAYVLLVLF